MLDFGAAAAAPSLQSDGRTPADLRVVDAVANAPVAAAVSSAIAGLRVDVADAAPASISSVPTSSATADLRFDAADADPAAAATSSATAD